MVRARLIVDCEGLGMDNIRCLKCGEADGICFGFEIFPKDVRVFQKKMFFSALKYYIPRLA